MSNFQGTRSDQAGFSPKEFLFKYLRFLPLFILSLVLSLIIAFFYLRYTSPTFQSKGALILTEDKAGGSSNDKFDKLFVDDRSKNISNELEYLQSKPLMDRVVTQLGLNLQYYAKGKIKQLNIYNEAPFRLQVLSLKDSSRRFEIGLNFLNSNSFNLGADRKTVYQVGTPFTTEAGTFVVLQLRDIGNGSQYNVRWSPVREMSVSLLSGLTAIPKSGSSGIIIITLESDNPRVSADAINQLMAEYQESIKQDKNKKNQQMLVFLSGRLSIVERELDSITHRINAYKAENKLGDVQMLAQKNYSRDALIEDQLSNFQLQRELIDMVSNYLSDTKTIYEQVPSSLTITDPTLSQQIQYYNQLQADRKKLVANNNTPTGNPKVLLLSEQIDKARHGIIESLRNVRQANLTASRQLDQRNVTTQRALSSLPLKEQILADMERVQKSKEELFKFLNEKKEETAISQAATISNTRMLEEAEVQRSPVRPTSGKVRGIALIIGLMIPLIFVLVLEIMDDKITSRNDIERHTAATVIGEIGHAGSENTLVVKSRSRSFIAEQFRIVRSNLQYVLTDTPRSGKAPVLLITSSFSGEGKSFVSTNMGAVMALAGKRTVILEFDLRKPKILSGLGISKRPGFSNFMLGKATIEELLVPVPGIDNLFVLPCGPIPPNPAELLLDKKLDELFEYLTTHYDFLVMDTAPVGMVGDAMTLASRYVDLTLYIVRQGVTHKKQLEMVNDFYKSEKMPKMNIILNDVKLRAGYGYYGYGRYGYGYGDAYGYGYGYGYYDDDVEGTSFIRRWFGWALPSKSSKKKAKKEKAG